MTPKPNWQDEDTSRRKPAPTNSAIKLDAVSTTLIVTEHIHLAPGEYKVFTRGSMQYETVVKAANLEEAKIEAEKVFGAFIHALQAAWANI